MVQPGAFGVEIADWPSRQVPHHLLLESCQVSVDQVRKAYDLCSNFTTETWVGTVAKAGRHTFPNTSEKRPLN